MVLRNSSSSWETLHKVRKFLSHYWILLVGSLVCALFSVGLQLYVPILFGEAIDGMVSQGQVDFLLIQHYLWRIFILILLASFSNWLMNYFNNQLTFRTVRDIRSQVIRKIHDLPLSYLDAHSTGDLVQRMIADIDQLSDGLLLGFTQLFSGIITILITFSFMFMKNHWITFVVLLLTPMSFVVANFISKKSYQLFHQQAQVRGKQTSLINELIGQEKLVKAFGYEERASKRFDTINKELQVYNQQAIFYSSITNPATRAINSMIQALVILIGAFFVVAGKLTVGGLSVLLTYANQYMRPFNEISSVVTELQNAMACAARVFELLEADSQGLDSQETLRLLEGKVDFQNISFSYSPDRPLIQNLSFEAKSGQKIAIVGATGCGKTTLINLLMRFYEVDQGVIAIDGQDIRQVSRASLRTSFGMVLQDSWIKEGTIRENITFGKPNASEEEIIQAAKDAHSWEFIRRMPKGLDTLVQADRLSQGQKQLLCITRVMICHPPLLILDEATSSIDTRTEVQIQKAFDRLMQGRTSFIVAHRLSTIQNADKILVMKEGKILEEGNHEELVKKQGVYNQLYQAQFAGSEGESKV